jgi:hypothetical protein
MCKGGRHLGNIREKVGDFRQNDDESRDNGKNDENGQKIGELAWCYCNKRRLIDRKRRGENWKLAFNGNYIPRGVWRNDLFRAVQKGKRSIQKRDRWRRGKGGSKMGGDGVKAPERKNSAGKSLQYVSEVQKP